MPIFARMSLHTLLAAGVLTAASIGPSARAEESKLATDKAGVEACLALAKKNGDARGMHGPDELHEKTGPKGRLGAAAELAPTRGESCIGVVSAACIQAQGNDSTAVVVECYRRETAAWDARLNAAYKKALAEAGGADVAEGFRSTQRAWIAFRDASCKQPYIVFKGTMAAPMEAFCTMDMTARQVIWLETWANNDGTVSSER